jgi:hypothetical protein
MSTVVHVQLPTNAWTPGQMSMQEGLQGTLEVSPDDCVYLGKAGDASGGTYVTWPKGYSATISDGRLTLLDSEGAVVARDGDVLTMGGGGVGTSDGSLPCIPEGKQIFAVQSAVTVGSG